MLYDYISNEASDSAECANTECPSPIVFSDPASGSGVAFPLYVRLYTDVPGATIRYTTDGTEVDSLSATYTSPILITSSGIVIHAIAHVEDCEPGPAMTVKFGNASIPFVFSYACDTPDNAGQWGEFDANGTNDHHWELQFTLAGATTITRLELYQLDSLGEWTTGQVWSTDSPIHPWLDKPDEEFEAFPLVVFDTAVKQWVAYQTSLGSFGAGSYSWDFYGDTVIAAGGLFRLDIVLSDGTKLSQAINAVCVATPPLCPPPAAPTVTSKCDGAVDVTFTGTIGRDYRIFYATSDCGTGEFQQAASGLIASAPQTVEISGLEPGCLYSFYVSIDEAGCGFKDSNTSVAVPKLEPFVSIATNKTIVDPNESFTISWNSRNIGGAVCGGCLDGQVSIDQNLGCKAGNVAGSQATSQAVCGIYTYTITGCNTCGTAIDSVQVEVRCSATCSGPQNFCIKVVESIADDLCPLIDVSCGMGSNPAFCGAGFWDQTLFNGGSGCSYIAIAQGQICPWSVNESCGLAFGGAECYFDTDVVPNVWRLKITGRDYSLPSSPIGRLLWEGTKNVGANAIGTYTQSGGCTAGLATLSITDQNCPI